MENKTEIRMTQETFGRWFAGHEMRVKSSGKIGIAIRLKQMREPMIQLAFRFGDKGIFKTSEIEFVNAINLSLARMMHTSQVWQS